jgi:hypothetical protein
MSGCSQRVDPMRRLWRECTDLPDQMIESAIKALRDLKVTYYLGLSKHAGTEWARAGFIARLPPQVHGACRDAV